MRTSRWVLATYAAIILFGLVTALPNLFSQPTLAQFPGWLPKQQVTLGLDLRGGSHLVLEVDAPALIQERVQSLFSEARRALREVGIDTKSVQRGHNAVTIVLEDATFSRTLRDRRTPSARCRGSRRRSAGWRSAPEPPT